MANRSVNDHRHSLLGSGAAGRKFDQFIHRPFCQPPLAEHDRPHRIVPVGQCDCGDGGGRGAGVAEQPEESARSVLRVWLKFAVGLVLMGGGFMLLALNAHQARLDGQASMGMMIAGLALMGFAELFIDPVAMAQITRLNLPGVTGVLTGIYMLATGAVANWLAGVVAQQTTESQISDTAVAAYGHFFSQMGEWTLSCVALIVAIVGLRWVCTRTTSALPQGD